MPEQTATPAAPVAPAAPSGDMGSMSDSDAFSTLDSFTADAPTPAAQPARGIAPATPAPKEDDEPAEPVAPARPTEKPVPPKDPKDGKFLKAATLRENYDRLKGEFKAMQEKHAKLEADAAARAQQPNGEAHLKELQTKYEALQKQHEDAENRLRFTSYEQSQEYKEKYEAPFVGAYQAGRETVASLRIVERKNDLEEVIQPSRPAAAADFDAIMASNDPTGKIEELFGTGVNAAEVNNARRDVVKANTARVKAIEEFRKQGGEREKQTREQGARQQQEQAQLYHDSIKASKEIYKDWFAPAENDPKGNALLEQGEALADLAHGVLKPEDVTRLPAKLQEKIKAGQFTPQDMVKLHAALRNKAMGFDRLASRYAAAQKQIKELEGKLGEYSASEPRPGQGGGRAAPAVEDSMESTVNSLDKLVQ